MSDDEINEQFEGKKIGSVIFTLYKEYHSFRALSTVCEIGMRMEPDENHTDYWIKDGKELESSFLTPFKYPSSGITTPASP